MGSAARGRRAAPASEWAFAGLLPMGRARVWRHEGARQLGERERSSGFGEEDAALSVPLVGRSEVGRPSDDRVDGAVVRRLRQAPCDAGGRAALRRLHAPLGRAFALCAAATLARRAQRARACAAPRACTSAYARASVGASAGASASTGARARVSGCDSGGGRARRDRVRSARHLVGRAVGDGARCGAGRLDAERLDAARGHGAERERSRARASASAGAPRLCELARRGARAGGESPCRDSCLESAAAATAAASAGPPPVSALERRRRRFRRRR